MIPIQLQAAQYLGISKSTLRSRVKACATLFILLSAAAWAGLVSSDFRFSLYRNVPAVLLTARVKIYFRNWRRHELLDAIK